MVWKINNKVGPVEVKEVSSFSFFGSSINKSLEEVKANHEDTCRRRRQEIQSILLDHQCLASWLNLIWVLPGLLIGAAAVFVGFVLIPFENVFEKPEHWYEMMLQCAIVGLGKIVHASCMHVCGDGFSLFFYEINYKDGIQFR